MAQMYARVVNNVVFEVWPVGTIDSNFTTPSQVFVPEIATQFIACPNNVQQGWVYSNGVFSPP